MTPRLLFAIVLSTGYYGLSAQNFQKFISLETGGNFISCQDVDLDYLRTERSLNYGYETEAYGSDIHGSMGKFYGGVRFELRSTNNKFGILTGLRYTQLTSSISRYGNPDYFYVRYSESETTTEYARVKELAQTSSYLCVPLEGRIYPWGQRRVSIYFLAGGEIGFQIATKNKIQFSTTAMNQYAPDILKIVGSAESFYSAVFTGGGITFGKEKPIFGIGFTVPVISSWSSLNSATVGAGINIQIQKSL